MNYQSIIVNEQDGIAEIFLNRPEKLNAINTQMASELRDALQLANKDEAVRVVILRGKGKCFCAGADLQSSLNHSEKPAVEQYLMESDVNIIYKAMRAMRKPIIASVHGYALGGGMGLVAMSHFSVAAEDASLGLPEVNIGLFPLGVVPVLWQVIGPKKSLLLGLLGEQITAVEAEKIGIISSVAPSEQLAEKTLELAKKVKNISSLALRMGIDFYNFVTDPEFWRNFTALNQMLLPFYQSNEYKDKVSLFINKRIPD